MRWTILSLMLGAMVLVPFLLFEDQFNALAAELVRGEGPRWLAAGGIFGLLALDVFLPVPSSLVSTAAGVLLGLAGGVAVVFTGMMTACLVGYYLGARGSGLARRLVGDDGLARAAELARRHGDWALVGCRPVPVLAEASVVFAGLVKAPFGRFVALTAASNLGISLGYAAIGAFSMRVESFLLAFLGAMLVPAIAIGLAKIFFSKPST